MTKTRRRNLRLESYCPEKENLIPLLQSGDHGMDQTGEDGEITGFAGPDPQSGGGYAYYYFSEDPFKD